MDTDIIPFVKSELLFESGYYMDSQSLFFRDRAIGQDISLKNLNFLNFLYPSQEECDTFGMDIPNASQVTRKQHFIESGVVVLNRTQHMPGLVLAASLHLWPEVSKIFWGDKELFTVGQLASGHNRFRLNMHSTGALGLIHDDIDPKLEKSRLSLICSILIAHVDDYLNLLWVNGGLRNCKLASWEKDWANSKYLREKFSSKNEMETEFLSPMKADGIIIPPLVPRSGFETRSPKTGFRKNLDLGCSGYTWCAYDTEEWPAIVIRFNKKEQELLNNITQLWWSKLDVWGRES